MFGLKTPHQKSDIDEEEKPFWISYSDLMTALMVLFLVAMSVALYSITQNAKSESEKPRKEIETIKQKYIAGPEEHRRKIDSCMAEVETMSHRYFPGVEVKGHSIGFGTLALFDKNKHQLAPTAEATLRAYVPKVLSLARSKACGEVFKRVIVEGFASRSGTYIHNLNLSLQRAERVICALLDPTVDNSLAEQDRRDLRNLFLVGGSSFNALKPSDAESQRIELKLEFLTFGEPREVIRDAPLDEKFSCPLDPPGGPVQPIPQDDHSK
jgi:outer membrane protein OmpA-like peptidoglycan-associated protein